MGLQVYQTPGTEISILIKKCYTVYIKKLQNSKSQAQHTGTAGTYI
jgi:hypothetical protein